MYKQLDSAIAFAALAHAGQVRRYDGLPYVTHLIEVMTLVRLNAAVWTEDMLIAAVCHDTLEDTAAGYDAIERRFGAVAAGYVVELTDVFTAEAHPTMNRRERKDAEARRMATISAAAQTIKYADFISNTRSIVPNDPGFARVYLREKEACLARMRVGDLKLLTMAEDTLAAGQTELMRRSLR